MQAPAPVATPRDPAAPGGDGETWWTQALFRIGEGEVGLGALAAAAAVLALAWLASRLFRRGLTRFARREGAVERNAAVYAVGRIAHYTILIIAAILALELVGLPASRFAVFAGALGVGLGFGLQAIFNNFVSGLILLFDRSLKVGDFVELESGVHGEVRDIKIRATTIVTNDNIDILVPNAEFVSGRVVNWTHRDVSRRQRIPFGVAYGSDRELVKKAALEAAAQVPFTLAQDGPRGPQVWLVKFGDSSLEFELVVWLTAEATKRPSAVRAAYNWALAGSLETHGLEIPFPQRDLHLRSLFGRHGHAALAALADPAAALDEREGEPDRGDEAGSKQLSPDERARLTSNDAGGDVVREIAREQARPGSPPARD